MGKATAMPAIAVAAAISILDIIKITPPGKDDEKEEKPACEKSKIKLYPAELMQPKVNPNRSVVKTHPMEQSR